MKRFTVLFCMMLFVGVITANEQQVASEVIYLQVRLSDPTLEHEPLKSAPIRIPTVILNDHKLIFETSCIGCLLSIINEEGQPVFMTTISDGTNSLSIPTCLSGEYIIQISKGRFTFWGYINL